MKGHYYEIEIVRTVQETAFVKVFVPDNFIPGQLNKYAEMQADAQELWSAPETNLWSGSLSRKEAAEIVKEIQCTSQT